MESFDGDLPVYAGMGLFTMGNLVYNDRTLKGREMPAIGERKVGI